MFVIRLLEMRTWQNRSEGTYILTLWTMTKFVVFVFRNRHPLTFSRYGCTDSLCAFMSCFLLPVWGSV